MVAETLNDVLGEIWIISIYTTFAGAFLSFPSLTGKNSPSTHVHSFPRKLGAKPALSSHTLIPLKALKAMRRSRMLHASSRAIQDCVRNCFRHRTALFDAYCIAEDLLSHCTWCTFPHRASWIFTKQVTIYLKDSSATLLASISPP